jgi:hypothetical protein
VKFRRYWSLVSPGVVLIRRLSLGLVKTEAERRARDVRAETDIRASRIALNHDGRRNGIGQGPRNAGFVRKS